MGGQGSAGNVVAAMCSGFIPGFGQLLQGRITIAVIQFGLAFLLWYVVMGWTIAWMVNLWSVVDAARFKPSWSSD
jgi:hypothetical protein